MPMSVHQLVYILMNNEEEVDTDTLIQLAQHRKVVAIGETGLDYFRSTGEIEWQRERFRAHIRAAKRSTKAINCAYACSKRRYNTPYARRGCSTCWRSYALLY